MKQTAVEWFVNSVFAKNGLIIYAELIEQAKAMEKEQIESAFNYGKHNKWGSESQINNGEDYYNETYNK